MIYGEEYSLFGKGVLLLRADSKFLGRGLVIGVSVGVLLVKLVERSFARS